MARRITLPQRSNAITFEPDEVIDIRLTLLSPEVPKGEGVVIADALDTEPKARVRCRNMVTLLKEPQTINESDIPADFWVDDETIMEFVTTYADDMTGFEAGEDAEQTYTLPAIAVRTHTVKDGDMFLPVLSVKADTTA